MKLFNSFAILFALSVVPASAKATYPEVTFRYSPMFDGSCAEATRKPVDPAGVAELERRMGEFERTWRRDAPALLGSVPAVTGVPFQFREARAGLILCEDFSSMSVPLMISVRPYLAATTGGNPASMLDFSNTIFHEVLHRYVMEWLESLPGGTTPLIEKYAAEHRAVRYHLHLYAIETLVYRRLGREKDLQATLDVERRLKVGPLLARARQLVAAEGAESLVREMRRRPGGRGPVRTPLRRPHRA